MSSKIVFNAGRILVVGSQGGGKTFLATKLSQKTTGAEDYQEEFGGTIETEFLKVAFENGKYFSLLLPIGGQEKWASLRSQFGETAEGIIVILDGMTKEFWPNSIKQATSLASMVPYDNYPIIAVITKEDQSKLIFKEIKNFSDIIVQGVQRAIKDGVQYFSRGFKIIERFELVQDPEKIPFSLFEQIVVNALEKAFFSDIVPGDAKKAKTLLPGFSLVNCRLFARALTTALSEGKSDNQTAVLSLLNEMRPTMLELDTEWNALVKKYPAAGQEPYVNGNVSKDQIEEIIKNKLLATEYDIEKMKRELRDLSTETGWNVIGAIHSSAFVEDGLMQIADLTHMLVRKIVEASPNPKFHYLEPLEELF